MWRTGVYLPDRYPRHDRCRELGYIYLIDAQAVTNVDDRLLLLSAGVQTHRRSATADLTQSVSCRCTQSTHTACCVHRPQTLHTVYTDHTHCMLVYTDHRDFRLQVYTEHTHCMLCTQTTDIACCVHRPHTLHAGVYRPQALHTRVHRPQTLHADVHRPRTLYAGVHRPHRSTPSHSHPNPRVWYTDTKDIVCWLRETKDILCWCTETTHILCWYTDTKDSLEGLYRVQRHYILVYTKTFCAGMQTPKTYYMLVCRHQRHCMLA